jgi:hypothetical protein
MHGGVHCNAKQRRAEERGEKCYSWWRDKPGKTIHLSFGNLAAGVSQSLYNGPFLTMMSRVKMANTNVGSLRMTTGYMPDFFCFEN